MATDKEVLLPDIGDFAQVDVIEVLVSPGDRVEAEASLVTLESDKATMEIPSPYAGVIKAVKVKVGDKVSQGGLLLTMDADDQPSPAGGGEPVPEQAEPDKPSEPAEEAVRAGGAPIPAAGQPASARVPGEPKPVPPPVPEAADAVPGRKAHASPGVRRFARQLGVDLTEVLGSGPKGRVVREDVEGFVKQALSGGAPAQRGVPVGLQFAPMPAVDFTAFGETETQALSKIKKISGAHLHRCWVGIPHVTQHDEADITDLEAFRKAEKENAGRQDVRLTLLPFVMKACVAALKVMPEFNASLSPDGESLILKKYFHIGVAVDTPEGLMVPVIREVDRKSVFDLARELAAVSERARQRRLSPADLQGGCFSISSLGGIGGTAFTPIINAPEVAILGLSRAVTRPVYLDGEFAPRLMLPLSLSYDHRVIDGAAGARFTTYLSGLLGDIRRLLL